MISFQMILDGLQSAIVFFVALIILFFPMEKVFPAYSKQKFFRPNWWVDLLFFMGQFLLWTILVISLITTLNSLFFDYVSINYARYTSSLPVWIQFIMIVLLSDLFIYWFHRWQHHNRFLWRFHKIHHTAKHLDWLAAYREHPVDTFFTILVINAPSILLGVNNQIITTFILFRGIWAVYIHSNIKFNIGFLKYIIGSPELHHWHHYKKRDIGNYANLSPMMDIIFKTHHNPGHFPDELGINEDLKENYINQLAEPLYKKQEL